jgi:Arc/MetJ-type ribon-helix-helix transcriptional regulator
MDIYLHTIEQIEQDLDRLIQEWALLKLSYPNADKAVRKEIQDLEEARNELWAQIEHLNELLGELYAEESSWGSVKLNRMRTPDA